ncbi:MAG: hypothetical protein D6744_16530, partial [Planctomycetota bacterium]
IRKPDPRHGAPPVPAQPTARRVEPMQPTPRVDKPRQARRGPQPVAQQTRRRRSAESVRAAKRSETDVRVAKQPSPEERVVRPSRRKNVADELRAVLMRPSGFRAAFLLSELLAPPVALREDHLERR